MSEGNPFARTEIKSTRQKCPLATAQLWVYVIDKNSKQKLIGAKVSATGASALRGQLPKSGACQFAGLPAGTYEVTASAAAIKGYQNATASIATVTIASGDLETVTIEVDVDEKVAVLVVDHAGLPLADEAYAVTAPNGASVQGKLTAAGWRRVQKIRLGGDCKLSFPQLDNALWEFVETTPGTDPAPADVRAATPAAVTLPSPYKVVAGDCLHSIAYRAGLPLNRIWNDPRNKDLKRDRKDPAVLLPGDSIAIPAKRVDKVESRATGATHKLRRTDTCKEYRLQVLMGEKPDADVPCEVVVDGVQVAVKKAGAWISFQIRPDAQQAVVTLSFIQGKVGAKQLVDKREYRIRLGHLRPVETPEGQEDRLRDLGYYDAWPRGGTPALTDVIQLFQASHGIRPADGKAGASTLDKLRKLAGDPA
jgi:LysM repeat protein